MVIDIISYTDEQLACLSAEQIMEVQTAQIKKNALLKEQAQAEEKERFRLMRNGMFRSGLYRAFCYQIEADYAEKIEEIRQALLFYLQYTSRPEDTAEQEAPYTVNYALPLEQRLDIVRSYYYETYPDPQERFTAFQQDEVARTYLGEFYGSLYHVFLDEIPS